MTSSQTLPNYAVENVNHVDAQRIVERGEESVDVVSTNESLASKRIHTVVGDEACVKYTDSKKQKSFTLFERATSIKSETIEVNQSVLLLFEQYVKNPIGCNTAATALGGLSKKYIAEMKHLYSFISKDSRRHQILNRDNPGMLSPDYKKYLTDLSETCSAVVKEAFDLYYLPYKESLNRPTNCDYASITLSHLCKARTAYNANMKTPMKASFFSPSSAASNDWEFSSEL